MKQSEQFELDEEIADQVLQNVFAACNRPPSQIPFDKLSLRKAQNVRPFLICRRITILFTCLMFIAPLFFYSPLHVKGVAASKISVKNHYMENNYFTIVLEGDNIDYESIYALTQNGETLLPQINKRTCEIRFLYEGQTLNIYIPTTDGNVLQGILSPKNQ